MPWRDLAWRCVPALLAALAVYTGGTMVITRVLGASPAEAVTIAGHDAGQTAHEVIAVMAALAGDVEDAAASLPESLRDEEIRGLFTRLAEARAARVAGLPAGVDDGAIGVTLEGSDGVALAWSGRTGVGAPGTTRTASWGATVTDAFAHVWHVRTPGAWVVLVGALPDEPGPGPAGGGFWWVGTWAIRLRPVADPPAVPGGTGSTFLVTAPSGAPLLSGEVSEANAALDAGHQIGGVDDPGAGPPPAPPPVAGLVRDGAAPSALVCAPAHGRTALGRVVGRPAGIAR